MHVTIAGMCDIMARLCCSSTSCFVKLVLRMLQSIHVQKAPTKYAKACCLWIISLWVGIKRYVVPLASSFSHMFYVGTTLWSLFLWALQTAFCCYFVVHFIVDHWHEVFFLLLGVQLISVVHCLFILWFPLNKSRNGPKLLRRVWRLCFPIYMTAFPQLQHYVVCTCVGEACEILDVLPYFTHTFCLIMQCSVLSSGTIPWMWPSNTVAIYKCFRASVLLYSCK